MDELLAGLNDELSFEKEVSGEQLERGKKKSALLVSAAVMMYILCLLPPILLSGTRLEENLAPALMFLMIACGTGLLIYDHMTKPRYRKVDDSIVEEFKEWKDQADSDRRAMKALSSALWSIITVIYIIISFWTMAWHITWVIFLIGAAVEGILKVVFELKR